MNVGEAFTRLALDQKQYERDFDKAGAYTQKKALTLGAMFKGAFSFALGMGIFQGFRSLSGALTDFVNTASRTETLGVAMQAVARSTGNPLAVLREQRDVMQDLGIAEQEATQMLTRFMQAQLDVNQAAKLARVAQDAAVIAGYNSSEAAEQLTEAIATQRPELLKAFGMSKDLTDIYSDYAKKLGIVVQTTDKYGKTSNRLTRELTDAEKRQAMLNHILASGERIAGTYESAMGSVGKKLGSLKRYWDTLKNAVAKPLALPIMGVIVDGVTSSLKNGIKWAEANKTTLQAWGQTAANAAKIGIKWIGELTRSIAQNWGHIKIAAGMLLAYAAAAKIGAIYTGLLSAAALALKGELVIQAGLLGLASKAVGIYNLQLALASAQGVVLTGVLAKLRLALYSVWTALGPVGWAILAISAAVGVGMALWNKYNQALLKTASIQALTSGKMGDLKTAEGLANAAEDEAKAKKKTAKAAGDNLQSFDEVHQLQEKTGEGEGDIPGAEIPEPVIPDYADLIKEITAGIGAGFDSELPPLGQKIKDFFGWVWDGVKEKWGGFKGWAGDLWSGIRDKWNQDWSSAGEDWRRFIDYLGEHWNGVKEKWGGFTTWVSEHWGAFRTTAGEIWGGIKNTVQTRWEELRTNAPIIWENTKTAIQSRWDQLRTGASTTWENIKTAISSRWNALKTEAPITWDNIKTNITTSFNQARQNLTITADTIKTNIATKWNDILTNIRSNARPLLDNILLPWDTAKRDIQNIIDSARNWGSNIINNLIDGIRSKISDLRSAVSTVVDTVKNFLGFSSPTKEGPGRYADQWAPNLMQMYAQGIRQNASMVQSAVSAVAEYLGSLSSAPMPAGGGGGWGGAGGGGGGTASGITLQVGVLVADDLGLKELERLLAKFRISENQRTGQEE